MKILHFDTGRTWRGGQEQVFLLMGRLEKRGIPQALASPEGSPLARKARTLGIEFFPLSASSDIDIGAGLRLRREVKKIKPDIVHYHTARALGVGCWALKGAESIRTVFTRRVDFPLRRTLPNRFKYRSCDAVCAVSGYIHRQLREFGGVRNLRKIYSCVDTVRFTPQTDTSEKGCLKAGMGGALSLGHKDFKTFIEAVAEVLRSRGDITFEIAGEGKDMPAVKNMVSAAGLNDRVIIRGFVEDMPGFLSGLDILVHTVHYEGLGTVILQGMACGLPVVATAVGGIPEAVREGVNGCLVERGSASQAAEKILNLASDADFRHRLGIGGREIAERKFSPEAMSDGYIELYRSL